MGRLLHLDYCAACHSHPGSAFVAYPIARILKPLSGVLDRIRLDIGLWYFHYLVSCLALAYLPFGKLFHLVSVPLSLAVRSVGSAQDNAPQNRPVRRALGLDAQAALEANDSYPFFDALGDLLRTGPTGTNVNDLLFILVEETTED